MDGRLQPDGSRLRQPPQVLHEGLDARAGVAEAHGFGSFMAVRSQEARLMGALGDIDPDGDHAGDLLLQIGTGPIPALCERPTPLCVNRGTDRPAHNLLIRGRSRSRGSSLSYEAACLKEHPRSPGSVRRNPTPWVTG